MKIRKVQAAPENEDYVFFCPACKRGHRFRTKGNPKWKFNGDMEKPTITPSVLVHSIKPTTDEEDKRILAGEKIEPIPVTCHSFITDGMIAFCGDSTHALAGKTVPLEDF